MDLNVFPVCDYGMPYAYAPCLCAHPEWLRREPAAGEKVPRRHRRGIPFASRDPSRAAEGISCGSRRTENDGFEVDPALAQRSAAFLKDKFIGPDSASWARWTKPCGAAYITDGGLVY